MSATASPQAFLLRRTFIQLGRGMNRFRSLTDRRYMPLWLYHAPVLAWLAWRRLKGQRLRYFCMTNPGYELGGAFGVSKVAVMRQLSALGAPIPKTLCVDHADKHAVSAAKMIAAVGPHGVVKPEFGGRSYGVGVFRSEAEAEALRRASADSQQGYVVQEFIPGDEYSVFCARDREGGGLRTIDAVHRRPLYVVGDGASTLAALVRRQDCGDAETIVAGLGPRGSEIPAYGERARVGQLGSHAHGCDFISIDIDDYPALAAMVDALDRFRGVDYFRADVMVKDDRPYILEINGAFSEPLGAYDPGNDMAAFYRRFFDVYRIGQSIGEDRYKAGARLPSRRHVLRRMTAGVALVKDAKAARSTRPAPA